MDRGCGQWRAAVLRPSSTQLIFIIQKFSDSLSRFKHVIDFDHVVLHITSYGASSWPSSLEEAGARPVVVTSCRHVDDPLTMWSMIRTQPRRSGSAGAECGSSSSLADHRVRLPSLLNTSLVTSCCTSLAMVHHRGRPPLRRQGHDMSAARHSSWCSGRGTITATSLT